MTPTVSVAHSIEPVVDQDARPGCRGEVAGNERGTCGRQ
jgi:hypothetical protein